MVLHTLFLLIGNILISNNLNVKPPTKHQIRTCNCLSFRRFALAVSCIPRLMTLHVSLTSIFFITHIFIKHCKKKHPVRAFYSSIYILTNLYVFFCTAIFWFHIATILHLNTIYNDCIHENWLVDCFMMLNRPLLAGNIFLYLSPSRLSNLKGKILSFKRKQESLSLILVCWQFSTLEFNYYDTLFH